MWYDNWAEIWVWDDDGNMAKDKAEQKVEVTDVKPVVTLVKSVDIASMPEPGGVFTFTLTITNNSVENVIITDLVDSQIDALSPEFGECWALIGSDFFTSTPILPGESISCTYTVEHVDAGTYENTATVNVVDNEFNQASDSDDETVTVTDVLPTVDLVKDVTPDTLAEPGGAFHFTLTITNTSVENVTITALTDDNPLPISCTDLIDDVLIPRSVSLVFL